MGTCLFWIVQIDDNTPRFIQCLITLLELELHFSNLASFIMMLYDPYIVGVFAPKIKDGVCYPIFAVFVDCIIIGICAMLLYLMVGME